MIILTLVFAAVIAAFLLTIDKITSLKEELRLTSTEADSYIDERDEVARELAVLEDDLANARQTILDTLEGELDEQDEQIRDAEMVIDALVAERDIAIESLNFVIDGAATAGSVDALYIDAIEKQLDGATALIQRYDAAAEKFIGKVDSGRARSTETYRELKAAYDRNTLLGDGTIVVEAVADDMANINS